MTPEQTITTDHVRSLLDAGDGATILGLIEGRVEVIAADRIGDEDHLGALEVISRDDLRERLSDDPSDDELAQQAAALTATVDQLGA